MGYLILFASIVAFTAYVWLIGRDPTTRVASYAYVNPLIALLLGSWLAHERPTPLQYAGAALVVAGVASTIAGKRVVQRESRRKWPKPGLAFRLALPVYSTHRRLGGCVALPAGCEVSLSWSD